MSWHVMFVETGYEDDVCFYINKIVPYMFEDVKFNFLVPKRKIYEKKQGVKREVIKKLFPGYVLVDTDEILNFYIRARGKSHIIRFLTNNHNFLEVEEHEIVKILELSNDDGLIDISKGLIVDEKIKVMEGPLTDKEGIIRKLDKRKGRAKVEFAINGHKWMIDLGVDILQNLE